MKKISLITILAIALAGLGWQWWLSRPATVWEVVLTTEGFEPREISIGRGDVVRFTTTRNEPFWPASNLHPLHTIYPQFDPKKPVSPDTSWSFKFNREGEWQYHDHLFPYYQGVIRVGEDTSASLADQHLRAHVAGEKLYDRAGVSGIVDCDNSFGFGCFHGFLLRAVGEGGVEAARKLDAQCVARFGAYGLGCPHGIGHGLGEYFGPGQLDDQLAVCEQLTWQGSLFGCQGGVFMEYNFPRQQTRPLQGEDYYLPCNTVADRFANACYFELPAWWQQVLPGDYSRLGQLCQGIANSSWRTDCFRGLGNAIAEGGGYTVDKVGAACSAMPDVSGQTLCLAGASWAFFANPDFRNQAESICQVGNNIDTKLCLQKAKLL